MYRNNVENIIFLYMNDIYYIILHRSVLGDSLRATLMDDHCRLIINY